METFVHFLEQYKSLSDDIKQAIENISQTIFFPKDSILSYEGDICQYIYLLKKGIARLYFYQDGKDVTNHFFFERDVVADMGSLYSKKQSYYNIQLLEDSEVISVNYSHLEKLYDRDHTLESIGRLLAIECFLEENERNRSFQTLTAKERYLNLLRNCPNLFSRVNLGYIASYIGISQVQLSRIRSEIATF